MKLSNRHKLIALLIASGKTNRWVARKLGLNENRVSVIKHSPLFQALVEKYQTEFVSRGMQSTIDKVLADGPANVDFIRSVRDGEQEDIRAVDDPSDRVRARLNAASLLFDRQMPKKQDTDVGTRVQIVVEARSRDLAELACAEVGAPIEVQALPPPAAQLVPRDLNELIEEYEAREGVSE